MYTILQGKTPVIDCDDLQTAIRALGATVGTNNYDASGATVVDFAF